MTYQYDEGKRTAGGFEPDHRQSTMQESWVRTAQDLRVDELPSHGNASPQAARLWAFERLAEGQQPTAHPAWVPKQEECANLLVPVCLSSSHVAYGSIRMEPVFMILGRSAGTAAALALDGQTAVQEVDYEQLKARLEKDGQRLVWN